LYFSRVPEPREARSIIEEAEQAAAAGNYGSAEDLLREAAALQEQTLGAQHPDLANTLNNLGIVCEITDNPIDAEHYFRRAHTIAAATLAPDHPFVATSRKNLHDFCAARGRPVELPPSPPAVAAWLEPPAAAVPPREPSPLTIEDDAPRAAKKSLRPLAFGALGGVALLIAILTIARPWGGAGELKGRPEGRPLPDPAPISPAAAPIAQQQPAAAAAQPARGGTEPGDGVRSITTERSTALPTVVVAQLCTALANWRCQRADSEVPPGPMFFFTQVKSETAATIEHRWYQGDRMHRAVQLRIEANPGAGYRTYSRNTIAPERAGDWRVELRSADGTVLHEERFTVR
jgi:hypothetical protein